MTKKKSPKKTLLEQARAVPVRIAPKVKNVTEEDIDLFRAFLDGSVTPPQIRAVKGWSKNAWTNYYYGWIYRCVRYLREQDRLVIAPPKR